VGSEKAVPLVGFEALGIVSLLWPDFSVELLV
jgi:hypothetical protein